MKPVIGVTCQEKNPIGESINKFNYSYIDAVLKSGGLPIVIPVLRDVEVAKDYIDIVDGIMFTGGEDISPLYFGEEPLKEVTNISPNRDAVEMKLFGYAHKKGIPVLGICRGMQLINIALGGSVYQDIYKDVPGAIGHLCKSNLHDGHHAIDIIKDSVMYRIMGKEKLIVNSFHHQSVKDLGEGLKATSFARDGLAESMEAMGENFVMGLQFHPERMINKHGEFLDLFKYFISKCK